MRNYLHKVYLRVMMFVAFILMAGYSHAQTFTQDGFTFEVINNQEVRITYSTITEGDLIIPEEAEYNGVTYTVTEIGNKVFPGNTSLRRRFTSVSFPSTVNYIGDEAFYSCPNITNIEFPPYLKYIGKRAFYNCFELKEVNIESVDTIGEQAFYLYNYDGLSSKFTKVSIKECKYIGEKAFSGTSQTYPNTYMLQSVYIGSGKIGVSAFSSQRKLNEVILGDGVTSIGAEAFDDCYKLTTLTLGNSIDTIAASAFYDCSSLPSLTIPASVRSIGKNAFYGCKSLKDLRIEDGTEQLSIDYASSTSGKNQTMYGMFQNSPLENLYIGRDIKYKTYPSFWKITTLKSVEFGSQVSSIPTKLFQDDDSIVSVKVPWLTPVSINENVFSDKAYQNATLFTPKGTEDAYKAANGWKNFTHFDDGRTQQTITWNQDAAQVEVGKTLNLTATASSGASVSYSIISGSDCAEIVQVGSGYGLKGVKTGSVTVQAEQAGNGTYKAAEPVTKTFIVVKGKQTIAWTLDKLSYTVGDVIELRATASSGLAVSYSISVGGNLVSVSIENGIYKLTCLRSGNVTIVASQSGNDAYEAAEAVSKTITINETPAVKQAQTITWNQDIEALAGQTVEMKATASSGLPVTYSYYLPGGGGGWQTSTINGASITFEGAGARIIIANQSGNDEYEAAVPDTMYFNVLEASEADGLMYIDGLYYKYTDDTHTALKVVRGYKSYQGDIIVPATANGLPVITLGTHAFYTADKLLSVEVGESVTNYEYEALAHSYNMTKLTLPSTSVKLVDWLCSGSRGLKEIHCHATVPYTCTSNVFNMGDDFYEQCVLYVPRGYADAYKATEPWSRFTHIVEEDMPTGIGVISADASDGYWYTLTGIRLFKKPVNEGVYIHCGKKVIVRK